MNNKGQTLVLFILLLPIITILLIIVINYSNLYIEKNKIENVVKKIITDELKSDDIIENKRVKINNLIYQNIDSISDYDLVINDEYIQITITKKHNKSEINVSYRGYIINDEIKIKREVK